MRERSVRLANSHNRWKETFDQLMQVEYVKALEARDARRRSTVVEPVMKAFSFS